MNIAMTSLCRWAAALTRLLGAALTRLLQPDQRIIDLYDWLGK